MIQLLQIDKKNSVVQKIFSPYHDTASTDRQKNSVVQKIFSPYHDTASTDRQKTVLFRKSFHHIMIQLLQIDKKQCCSEIFFTIS